MTTLPIVLESERCRAALRRRGAALLSSFLILLSAGSARGADCPAPLVVQDATGLPLPDTHVVVSPGEHAFTTNAQGSVCLDALPEGRYEVTAHRPGFEELRQALRLPAAAAAPLRLRPVHHESVVVTGARAERRLSAVPYSISVVEPRQLDTTTADSPGELLRDVPGLQVTDTSLAGGKRLRIRGEVGSNVLVLLDGREISEQRSFHGGAPLLLDLAEVERVEVVRGPSSVVYGSKAIGGTVNFISRPPAAEPFTGRASLTFNSATAGYDGGASLSGTLAPIDYRVSASRSDHGDRRVPREVSDNGAYSGAVGRLENSGFDTRSLTAEVGHRWSGSRVALRVEDYASSVESHTSDDVLAGALDTFQLDLPRQDRRALAATYRGTQLAPRMPFLAVTAYRQRRARDFDQTLGLSVPDFAGPRSSLRVDAALGTVYEQDTTGLLTSLEWLPARAQRVVAGLDLVRDELNANITDVTTTTITLPRVPRPLVDVTVDSPVNRTRQDSAGVFVQDEVSLSGRWKAVLGVRYNVFDSALRSTTSANLEPGSVRRGRASWTAALVHQPSARAVLRASYSQGYRHPSLLELYEGTAHGSGGLLFPNPDLKPETSDNFEIGARLAAGRLALDASAFFTRARDYVTTRACAAGAPCPARALPASDRVYDNVDGARTRGVEALVNWQLEPLPLELFAEASYLHRRFESPGRATARTGLPRVWGQGGLRVGRTRAHERRYFGELTLRAAGAAEEDLGGGASERYPGWASVSARAGVDFGSTVPVTLTLEVANLFDKAYRPAQETLFQPGRHVLAKVVTRF